MAISVLSLPPDVLARVCSHLWTHNPYTYRGRGSLSMLARTCSEFHEPAISVLWRSLHNIVPLLYTLPSDLCVTEAINGNEESSEFVPSKIWVVMRFVRVPAPGDFHRWYKYAALVRELTHDYSCYEFSKPSVHPEVWEALGQRGPSPLVPQLLTLDSRDFELNKHSLDTVSFFSPTLSTVRLHLSDADRDLAYYLNTLAALSPNVQELHLEHEPCSHRGDIYVSITDHLLKLRNLRELRVICLYIHPSTLALIGSLPCLQTLEVWLSPNDHPTTAEMPIILEGGAMFAELRELEVWVDEFPQAFSLLDCVSSTRLQSLSIRRSPRLEHYSQAPLVTPSLLGSLFTMVASHPSRETFRRLEVAVDPVQPPCDLSETILPLLTLPALAELEIKGWALIVADAATLDAMSRAWPRLEQLNLHDPKPVRAFPEQCAMNLYEAEVAATPWETTLADLVPLALRCPLLKSLGLSVNTWPDLEGTFPEVRFEDSSLVRLYVGYDAEPGEGVAEFLAAVFPRLERVRHGDYDEHRGGLVRPRVESSPGWSYVSDVLAALHLVRKQEWRWAEQRANAAPR
ncbi:hypothetical protein OH76DRAFT_1412613 [Lentinus brumalis]|uniref:F-box domain-containing protein n=1 Tax=Lentinus brumalis TaxID=2498619 RepID=A0A371CKS3_9APHY|nr:hypothetical protein OH76DRAFT_1412613 [Polyporus brumalis]